MLWSARNPGKYGFAVCFNALKCSKPCKICDLRHVSMLRSARNLKKKWFALCASVIKCSKPCKISRLRHVPILRSARSIVKYAIRGVFACFGAPKCSESRKIYKSRCVPTLSNARNLVKYVISSVLQCFEVFNTSQNIWFVAGFNAPDCTKPNRIRDSRRASVFRSARNLVECMIHGLFQCFKVRRIL